MNKQRILIVDDEPNTRTTLEQALEPLDCDIMLAESGEEALSRIDDPAIGLVLLDLRLPGASGLEVLREIQRRRPDVRVVIITAHGNVPSAVESMKNGAVDLLQKPFSLERIRDLARSQTDEQARSVRKAAAYDEDMRDACAKIRAGHIDAAIGRLHDAIMHDPDRPDGYNLLGVIAEIRRDRPEAQRQYRHALEVDPTHAQAACNLRQSMGDPVLRGPMLLGDGKDPDA
jgi:two-component system, OmpR family, alkaline phosphatase synthesis response regulator PhoP